MSLHAKYVHTNIVARDWRGLARFYEEVFGCQRLPPERHYHGPWVGDVTALRKARLEGIHLRLPGCGPDGPTLEIFQYDPIQDDGPAAANRKGFAHIAFHVADVALGINRVLDAGGKQVGKLHTMEVPAAGRITLVYMSDPEGNIIELQKWD